MGRKRKYKGIGKTVGNAVETTLTVADIAGQNAAKNLADTGKAGMKFVQSGGETGKRIVGNLGAMRSIRKAVKIRPAKRTYITIGIRNSKAR